jgi:hypothetical protein
VIRGLAVYCLAAAIWVGPKIAHAQDLPSGTMDCLGRLQQAQTAVVTGKQGPPRLGDVCPEVAEALAAGPWGAALPEGDLRDLTAGSLRRLIDLVRHYRRAPARSRNLSPAKLSGIIAGLEPFEPKPPQSLWDRIVAKLREWLGLDGRDGGELARWLHRFSIPAVWSRVLVSALGLALVAGVVAVLINELRDGGALRRRTRWRRASPARPGAAAPSVRVSSFDDVLSASPSRQPVVLFALLVERLRSRHAALVRESSTHRELVAAARRQGLKFAASLGAVAAAAEGVTFGDRLPGSTELEAVLRQGKSVLRDLDVEPEPAA